jgi:hypothetical protein
MPTWLGRKSAARPRGWHCLLLALQLVWLLAHGPACAQNAPRRIRVVLAGRIAQDPSFGERVKSWFDATQFDVAVRTQSHLDANHVLLPDNTAELHVFFVVSGEELARLYFAWISPDSHQVTYLLRDVELSTGLDELGKERMAQVATLSAAALLDGQAQSPRAEIEETLRSLPAKVQPSQPTSDLTPSTAPPPIQRTPQTDTAAPKSKVRWGAGFGYGLSPRGDEGFWHGPRASLDVGLGWLDSGLMLQGFLPVRRNLDGVELRTLGVSAWLGVGSHVNLRRSLVLRTMVGPGFDLVRYRSDSSLADVEATRGATELRPTLATMGLLESRELPVRLLLGASLQLVRTHYDAVGAGSEREVLGRARTLAFMTGLEVCF